MRGRSASALGGMPIDPINSTPRCAVKSFMTKAWDIPPPPREAVENTLDRVRPALVADGGNVELEAIDPDGTLRLTFQGTCTSCPAQLATLRVALEPILKKAHPGIHAVIAS